MAILADSRVRSSEEVRRSFRSAYFSLFSVPDPQDPDVPIEAELPFPFSLLQRIPNFPQLLTAVEVNERPLRFSTTLGESACQLLATNTVGDPIASVHIRWTPIPWDYPANPDANPPPTILNPLVSQRFTMLDGEFRFDDHKGADGKGTGIHGFGSGRTFPRFPNGLALRIGAVIDMLQGFGEFKGREGLAVVNGIISPPNDLDLNIMMRIRDPSGGLISSRPLPPLNPRPFPDPDASFLVFEAEPDPARPSRLLRGPGGQVEGIELHELLRPLDLDFAVVPNSGLKSSVEQGELVGRASRVLHFPVGQRLDGQGGTGATLSPIPVWTQHGEFSFEAGGRRFGTVRADLVEGRGFNSQTGSYRVGGFGPVLGGTGQFEGADGLLSMNAMLSLDPLTFSNLYVFRFRDKAGRYRRVPSRENS